VSIGKLLLAIGTVIVIAPIVIIFWGWSASILWGWFVVPVFDVPALGIAQSIGLCSAISIFTGVTSQSVRQSLTSSHDGDEKSAFVGIFTFMIMPVFILTSGWIVKSFI